MAKANRKAHYTNTKKKRRFKEYEPLMVDKPHMSDYQALGNLILQDKINRLKEKINNGLDRIKDVFKRSKKA